jgi:hypothetical protein
MKGASTRAQKPAREPARIDRGRPDAVSAKTEPAPDVRAILDLQRLAGNRAVEMLLQRDAAAPVVEEFKTPKGRFRRFPTPAYQTNQTDRPIFTAAPKKLEAYAGAGNNGSEQIQPAVASPLGTMMSALLAEGEKADDESMKQAVVASAYRAGTEDEGERYLGALQKTIRQNPKIFGTHVLTPELETMAKTELGARGSTAHNAFKQAVADAWGSADLAAQLINITGKFKAPRGGSAHQFGLTVDINFPYATSAKAKDVHFHDIRRENNAEAIRSGAGNWLSDNAAGYGFASYDTESEIWHQEWLKWKGTEADPDAAVSVQRTVGWKDAPTADAKLGTQGINAGPTSSGAFKRYPVSGLSVGNTAANPDPAAWEEAGGRAIVLIPDKLDPKTAKVDVLFLLHGHSIGWREGKFGENGADAKKPDPIRSEFDYGYAVKGETRDRFPDDLSSSLNPNMIAVLPQGTNAPAFGNYETVPYIRAALKEVGAEWENVTLGRVVLSAHSGGGPNITAPLAGDKPYGKTVKVSDSVRDIVLFDAINGFGEEANVETWLTKRIAADLANLAATPGDDAAQQAYLSTSLRFKAYFSTTLKGSKKYPDGFYITQHEALRAFIAQKLKKRPEQITPQAWDELNGHYHVVGPESMRHDDMIRKNVRDALDTLGLPMPASTTTPAKTPAISRSADTLTVQRTQTDDVEKGFKAGGKAKVFAILRQWGSQGPITEEPTLEACLDRLFGPNGDKASDDRRLAGQIIKNGSEPHWPKEAFQERATRAHDHKWAAESGGIEGSFDAGKGKIRVEAYFFAGTSDRKAMIIGGVHGTEPGGVEVVNDLLADLRQPDAPTPFFSVIVVPEIFPENLVNKSRTTTDDSEDPNRNFPKVGTGLEKSKGKGKVPLDSQGREIEPGNVILIDLIERFQPERIASVHGHSVPKGKPTPGMDMPGIFDDPRAGKDEKAADDALGLKMAKAANKKGVRVPGNWLDTKNETSEYPPGAPKMSKGVSLGDYGPTATDARPAMTVITIETFGNDVSSEKSDEGKARKKELESLASVLQDIFLGPPDKK